MIDTVYAQRFECRPEYNLLGELVPAVVDASSVRERPIEDLKVIPVTQVFSSTEEVFMGFGKPNEYLVVPNGKGGYQKFAVKSLKRGPSQIVDARFVQSGILIRLKNMPPEVAEKLREGMHHYEGQRFKTCVHGCMHVLAYADFTLGDGTPLTDNYLPYSTLRTILRNGLARKGQKVEFDVIRTTKGSLEKHSLEIVQAVVFTLPRHITRTFTTLAKTNAFVGCIAKIMAVALAILMKPLSWIGLKGKCPSSKRIKAPIAPALPMNGTYCNDLTIKVSGSGLLAACLRKTWGAHTLFELQQNRVDINNYLPETLEPFPQKNPDLFTRAKKMILMSPTTVNIIRSILVPNYEELGAVNEMNVYDMMRTHSELAPNKYNLVITTDSIIIARTSVGWKFVDWLLSKHIVLGGWGTDKRFGGECWKDEFGVLHINNNSGTLRPKEESLNGAVAYVQAVLPHLHVVKD